jgi:hypothetical protein
MYDEERRWLYPSHLPRISKKTKKSKQGGTMKRLLLLQVGLLLMSGATNVNFAYSSTPTTKEVQVLISQTEGNWSFKRLDATHRLADAYYTAGQAALGQKDYVTAEGYFFSANTDSADNRAAFCSLRQIERLQNEDPEGSLRWVDTLRSRYEAFPYLDTALLIGASLCLRKDAALKGATYLNEFSQRNPGMLSSAETSGITQDAAELCLVEINSKIASQEYGSAKAIAAASRSWIPTGLKDSLRELEQTIKNNEDRDRLLQEGAVALNRGDWHSAIYAFRGALDRDHSSDQAKKGLYRALKAEYGWSDDDIDYVIKGTPRNGMNVTMIWVMFGTPDKKDSKEETARVPVKNIYDQVIGYKEVYRYFQTYYYFDRGFEIHFETDKSGHYKVVKIKPLKH